MSEKIKYKNMTNISLKLKDTLLFREELIEKKEYHRKETEKLRGQLEAINKLLESFGIINFTEFDAHRKFNPIIDTYKNDIFK